VALRRKPLSHTGRAFKQWPGFAADLAGYPGWIETANSAPEKFLNFFWCEK
jgi:hypothetical protein